MLARRIQWRSDPVLNRDFRRAAYRVQWQRFDLNVRYYRIGQCYRLMGWPRQVHPEKPNREPDLCSWLQVSGRGY